MSMWETPAGPAGGNGGCAGQVMYDGRHEPNRYPHELCDVTWTALFVSLASTFSGRYLDDRPARRR